MTAHAIHDVAKADAGLGIGVLVVGFPALFGLGACHFWHFLFAFGRILGLNWLIQFSLLAAIDRSIDRIGLGFFG